MAVTTPAQEYKRLRSYLNPYIKGPNTDAVLNALASSMSSYLINNIAGVNDQLYIATASGTYLDERLAQYGISRPPNVGLSDEIFSEIGIAVKNRKQVRDLVNILLDAMFGDGFTKATDSSGAVEPYNLANGDTLIINFDGANTATIIFNTAEFQDIAAATAQEVADAITSSLRSQGISGSAISNNNGNGNYVEIISNTIGASSSVTVMGGSAENELQFAAVVPAGGNMSTQWTISLQPGGFVRFTWSGGANPNTGLLTDGNYVNIFGGGFTSSDNEGTYTITSFKGGAVNVAYFEVENPLGTSGIVTQGTDDAVLFYNPVRKTLISNRSYAAVYQVQANMLQIFLPVTTTVVRRGREGSAHVHYPPQGTFVLNVNPASGDIFSITSTVSLVADVDFIIGATPAETVQNIIAAINTDIPGLIATANSTVSVQGTTLYGDAENTLLIQSDDDSLVLTISYTGAEDIVASGPLGANVSLEPNQYGPYSYDLTQTFTVSSVNTTLEQELDGTKPRVIQVANSSEFPNSIGFFMLGYGTELQEGPIPYLGTPSGDTLLISPAYTIKNTFQPGTTVSLIAQNNPPVLATDGSDWEFFLTDITSGRIYAQDLIQSITATGINVVFTILYPSDIGLGKFGTIYSENPIVWGP
jgi:hypothetical protein